MTADLVVGLLVGFVAGCLYVAVGVPWIERALASRAHRYRLHRPIRVRVDDR